MSLVMKYLCMVPWREQSTVFFYEWSSFSITFCDSRDNHSVVAWLVTETALGDALKYHTYYLFPISILKIFSFLFSFPVQYSFFLLF